MGNLVIGLGTLGAHLGHKIVFPGAQLGHDSRGTVGAKSYLGHTWGTSSWGTLGAKK